MKEFKYPNNYIIASYILIGSILIFLVILTISWFIRKEIKYNNLINEFGKRTEIKEILGEETILLARLEDNGVWYLKYNSLFQLYPNKVIKLFDGPNSIKTFLNEEKYNNTISKNEINKIKKHFEFNKIEIYKISELEYIIRSFSNGVWYYREYKYNNGYKLLLIFEGKNLGKCTKTI